MSGDRLLSRASGTNITFVAGVSTYAKFVTGNTNNGLNVGIRNNATTFITSDTANTTEAQPLVFTTSNGTIRSANQGYGAMFFAGSTLTDNFTARLGHAHELRVLQFRHADVGGGELDRDHHGCRDG